MSANFRLRLQSYYIFLNCTKKIAEKAIFSLFRFYLLFFGELCFQYLHSFCKPHFSHFGVRA